MSRFLRTYFYLALQCPAFVAETVLRKITCLSSFHIDDPCQCLQEYMGYIVKRGGEQFVAIGVEKHQKCCEKFGIAICMREREASQKSDLKNALSVLDADTRCVDLPLLSQEVEFLERHSLPRDLVSLHYIGDKFLPSRDMRSEYFDGFAIELMTEYGMLYLLGWEIDDDDFSHEAFARGPGFDYNIHL